MALPTISPTDFSGFVNISADTYSQSDFAAYITDGTEQHLRELLGDAAYIDIRDNTRTIYTALFAGVDWVDSGDNRVCDSLKSVLEMLIYADWVLEGNIAQSDVGAVMNMNENAVGPNGGMQGGLVAKRLARAARCWENITDFIEEFRTVTETISAVDNTDPLNPVLTVSGASTMYLETGDTVTILGTDYTAASVTATTFAVTVSPSGLGSTFVGQSAIWEPLSYVQSALPEIQVGIF